MGSIGIPQIQRSTFWLLQEASHTRPFGGLGLNGILLNCLSRVATYQTFSSTQPEGCLMTVDDNQQLRQLLKLTEALICSMDVARRGHTENDRTAWFSYKVFAKRYMAIIHQLPQDFPALGVLNPYDTSIMPEPSSSRPS